MCTLDWQETQCSLQQPPLRDKSCPWNSPIGLLNSQASCESSAAPQKQFISLRLKASHNTPVDSSILCQSKPIFLLVSSAPPSLNICSIFLHYKHRRDWPDKSKGWGGKAGIVFRSEHRNISCSFRDLGALQTLSRSGAIWVLLCSRSPEYFDFKQTKKENPPNPSSSFPQTKNVFFLF